MQVTMSKALIDQQNNDDALVASGPVIEMHYPKGKEGPSLRASKMLHLLVKNAGPRIEDDVKHEMPFGSLSAIGNMTKEEIKSTMLELVMTALELRGEEFGEEGVLFSPVLSKISRVCKEKDTVHYHFTDTMREVFSRSSFWALLSRDVLLRISGKYALRIYELVVLKQNLTYKTSEEFSLEDFRSRLGVPDGSFYRWQDFKTKLLEPALKDLNRTAGMNVSYKPIKGPGTSPVRGVRLVWAAKDPKGKRKKEAPFPQTGTIHYGPWGDLAREYGGGYDVDTIAAQFRKFAEARGFKLDAKEISKAFQGFCKSYKSRRPRL